MNSSGCCPNTSFVWTQLLCCQLPVHLCSEYASFKRPLGRAEDSLWLGSSPVPVVSSSVLLASQPCPGTADPGPFQSSAFLHEEMPYGSSAGHGGQTVAVRELTCMWAADAERSRLPAQPACLWITLGAADLPCEGPDLSHPPPEQCSGALFKTKCHMWIKCDLLHRVSVSLGELAELEPKSPSAICFLAD